VLHTKAMRNQRPLKGFIDDLYLRGIPVDLVLHTKAMRQAAAETDKLVGWDPQAFWTRTTWSAFTRLAGVRWRHTSTRYFDEVFV
jgi:hypothetical protein